MQGNTRIYRMQGTTRPPLLSRIWVIDLVLLAIMLVLFLSFLHAPADVRLGTDDQGCDSLACVWP